MEMLDRSLTGHQIMAVIENERKKLTGLRSIICDDVHDRSHYGSMITETCAVEQALKRALRNESAPGTGAIRILSGKDG